jgi:hypothetical protein
MLKLRSTCPLHRIQNHQLKNQLEEHEKKNLEDADKELLQVTAACAADGTPSG